MTYRQWLKKAKKARAAAAPDIRDRLPLSADVPTCAPPRSVVLRRVCAGVAAAAVLVCVIGCVGWGRLFGDEQGETPAVSTPDDTPTIPLHTMVQAVTMLHSGMPSDLIDNVNAYNGTHVLEVMFGQPTSGHEDCHGVYYDLDQENYFCASHAVTPALERRGLPTNDLLVHYYHPTYNRIVFTCKDSARSSFVYDITEDTLYRLPVSLYHCPLMLSALLSDHPYVLLHKMGGDRDDIYVLNLVTAELDYVLKDSKGDYVYTPMDDSRMTTDGKYVYYTLMDGGGQHVNSPARTTVVYDVATGESCSFIGEVWSEVAGTTRLLIKDPDGFAVYDAASGVKIRYAEADLPTQYDYYVRQTDLYTDYEYRLLLVDRNTGEETLLTEDYIAAYAYSTDRRYLYYYVRGEDSLRVRDMARDVEEYLPLEDGLVQETEGEANKERSIRFALWLDEQYDEVWLYYTVTEASREDPETIRQAQEDAPSTHLDRLRTQEEFTSILSLEPILRRFPDCPVTAYEGDGFLYVNYTGLTANEDGVAVSNLLIALEDYDNGRFYDISHQSENADSKVSSWDEGDLPADAKQNTRRMLEELDIPIEKAQRDYRSFFSDDPQVKIKARLAELNGERVRSYNFCYVISEKNGYSGEKMYLESDADLQELYEFIDFTDGLTYYKLLSYYDEETQNYYRNYTYLMKCLCWEIDEYELYIGRKDGRPFLVKNGCLADLTEEQYSRWSAWMDKQEPKVHIN